MVFTVQRFCKIGPPLGLLSDLLVNVMDAYVTVI